MDKLILVELFVEINLFQFFLGMIGMLVLQPVMEGPEAEVQFQPALVAKLLHAGDQLLPEPGGGPVLDRVARTGPLAEVVTPVPPLEAIGKMERGGPAMLSFPDIVKRQPQRLDKIQQPLKMRRLKPESPSLDSPLRADETRVCRIIGIRIKE